MYTLYVIPGSHACRSAMLMLDHKGVPYRRVEFVTLTHPVAARLCGFDAGRETRAARERRPPMLRLADRLGTVPGLAVGRERISTNRRIARFLDERHPEPPLFPGDPDERQRVEEVESWANETLQMTSRVVALSAAMRDPSAFGRRTAGGRLGHLLYRRELPRRLVIPLLGRAAFAVDRAADDELLAELSQALDKVDGWIEEGVLGGERPTAADFMVVPSLALVLYRPDVQSMFEGRPSLDLVDRLLPASVVEHGQV